MHIINKIYIPLACLLTVAFNSCTVDEPMNMAQGSNGEAIFVAGVGGLNDDSESGTRAKIAQGNDYWSYTRFDNATDTIGFYSLMGNLNADGGNGSFLNEPMVFVRAEGYESQADRLWKGVFRGVNMDYDIGMIHAEGNKTFVYFPYSEFMEDKGKGLRLRKEVIYNGVKSYRCIDALYIGSIDDNTNAVMSGDFNHNFCELRITRGEGFDSPPEGCERITVVTTEPYTHVRVINNPYSNHADWKILEPYYDEDNTWDWSTADKQLTPYEACKRWDTWKGEPIQTDPLKEPVETNYVIIPTAISNSRSTVEYIEICDNNGLWHKITSFALMNGNDKRANPTYRVPVEVRMEGLIPTIYPYTISEWDDPENITDERSRGINSPSEFYDFLMAYNRYIDSNRTNETGLENFGDRSEKDGVVGWHFYLNQDIDMRNIQTDNVEFNYRITELADTLDGLRHSITNLRINNDSGFIGEMTQGSCLRDLEVSGITVTNNYASTQVTGGLVDLMSGGVITGCSVDGNIRTPGIVGMAVGTMTGGSVTNCTFTGVLSGGSTYNNLFGLVPTGESSWSGNRYSGLIFTRYN